MKNSKLQASIRTAEQRDVNHVYKIGTTYPDFAVSKRIRFYTKSEVREFIHKKSENILLVAEQDNNIIGFLSCKIMSHNWAMIDNLFIIPKYRGFGNGRALLEACLNKLKKRKIDYVTRLIKLEKFSKRYPLMGFKPESKYIWVDEFIS